jgi:MFS family permease
MIEQAPSEVVTGRAHAAAVLVTLAVSVGGYALASTQLLPGLPTLQERFGASPGDTTWVLTAYMLVGAVGTPIVGRMGDMYGRRRMLVVVVAVYFVGSLAAAFADSLAVLIAARCLQGLAGSLLPLAFGIVRDVLPRERVAIGIATIGAMTAIGGGIGLPLGGFIVDHFSIRVIFFFGAALGAIAMAGALLFIPDSGIRAPGRLDVPGALLLAIGLVAPLIAVSSGVRWGWTAPSTLGLLGLGLVVLPLWWRFERGRPSPLVDIEMITRGPVGYTILTTLLMGFALFGSFSLIPRLAQTPVAHGGFGMTATVAGLLMMPTAVVNALAAPLFGAHGREHGSKKALLFGCVIAAAGLGWLSLAHTNPVEVVIGGAILGIGFAGALAAAPNIIIGALSRHETGSGAAANTLVQNLGSSVGSQVAVTIVLAGTGAGGDEHVGYTWAFALAALAALLAIGIGLRIPAQHSTRSGAVDSVVGLSPDGALLTTYTKAD